MFFFILLREHSKTFYSLTFHRAMGGGPRTFPGGLNKWQWKRLHEKKAREKEKRLLDHEKQLFQARVRTKIRSELASQSEPYRSVSGHGPMSPAEHIKTLADRFMKAGAEDLWNEDDGPIRSLSSPNVNSGRVKPIDSPIDVRKLVESRNVVNSMKFGGNFEQRRDFSVSARVRVRDRVDCGRNDVGELVESRNVVNLMKFGRNLQQKREYSADVRNRVRNRVNYRRNESSSSDDDGYGYGVMNGSGGNARWPRFTLNEDGTSSDDEREGRDVRRFISSAALGKYDVKTTKRRVMKDLMDEAEEDDDSDLLGRIQEIRREVNARKVVEKGGQKDWEEEGEESIHSGKRFEDCGISPLTVKSLSSAGYVWMTRVQEATLSVCVEGKDALVKARTGTGKTAAFLLPAIEAVLRAKNGSGVQRVPPVYVLIICPTRELASQVAAETRALLKYHDGIGVQVLVGGTRFKDDRKRLESDPCQILVATPGRLLDHIEDRSSLSARLMGLKMVVVDEADHLLDLGFRKDMEKIVDCLPRQRHSLLFSATIPKEVRRVSQLVLKRDHAFIDVVGVGSPETHSKVKQSYIVTSHDHHFQITHQLLKEHISRIPDYKVIVFCTTATMASLMYVLFREMQLNVREIHSRKPQLYRSRISEEFKQFKRLILISSDVSARGMNYPDVTLVVQVGIPPDREQYIHRLGRTGRAGKEGEGVLVLAPWEEYFLDDLKDLPMERSSAPILDPDAVSKIKDYLAKIDPSVKEAAYHAWLGYYNSISEIGRDKTTLVELASQFSHSIGLQKPPALFRKTALKMGLKDIAGIRIRK